MDVSPQYFLIAFKLLGSLAMLMYGMKVMSEALQKMAGPQLRHVLGTMTTNRFTAVLAGMFVTATVQSSTATTVMTVSFVNAGLLTLAQAIGIIMGANIGTTLTAWIMSAGFSFNITNVVWPAFFLGIILIYSKKKRYIGDFLFGISFLLLGLGTLRETGISMNLGESAVLLDFFSSFDPKAFSTTILFLLMGGILTFCVQSSAAVMAITMILCSSGVLPIYQGIALVMGENIGTTVTSNIAALTANIHARRAAFAHLFFNVFGVLWVLAIFHPFADMACHLVGFDPTMTRESAGQAAFLANASLLSFVLAVFHTCFNLINTMILIWFIPQIERYICPIIKPRKNAQENSEKEGETFRLEYLQAGLMRTPEIAVLQAQKEILAFAERIKDMFGHVRELLDLSVNPSGEEFQKLFARIEKYEEMADNTETEIARYLSQAGNAHMSDDGKAKSRAMLREISELESVGDACFNISRALKSKVEKHAEPFTGEQVENIRRMMTLTGDTLSQMITALSNRREDEIWNRCQSLEDQLNATRSELKEKNIDDINAQKYSYVLGSYYTDIINECEKLGDYVVNVVESRYRMS